MLEGVNFQSFFSDWPEGLARSVVGRQGPEHDFSTELSKKGELMASGSRVRYAVVGLGHIAQAAVLPGFKNATENSELTTLISGVPEKLHRIGDQYRVSHRFSYAEYEAVLSKDYFDAVYIATPNSEHQRFAELAARYGKHVLVEKPMATTVEACESMRQAAVAGGAKLMVAYRLHFEEANLRALELSRSKLGDIKVFNSLFHIEVPNDNNIRLNRALGGGTVFDLGIYCINAARNLFNAEPIEVYATSAFTEARFSEVDESTSVVMRFPADRLATFTSSFGTVRVSSYDLIGSKGRLRLESAYEYATGMTLELFETNEVSRYSYPKRDQFGPELIYFSDCIINDTLPEPSADEGLADVRVIEAVYESANSDKAVSIAPSIKMERPSIHQVITRPAV